MKTNLPYIQPRTREYDDFEAAQQSYESDTGYSFFMDQRELDLKDLSMNKKALVVGKPGIGKTAFLEQLEKLLKKESKKEYLIYLVRLREFDAANQIRRHANRKTKKKKIFLLDGLDELKADKIEEVINIIKQFDKADDITKVFVSSRWSLIRKQSAHFPSYRYISILPFSRAQVREYLIGAGLDEEKVSELILRKLGFSYRDIVIQTPRYLSLLIAHIKEQNINSIEDISRENLFESLINSRLGIEEEKLQTSNKEITRRILEKIALVMEVYRSNSISLDELMTLLDELDSDLKTFFLTRHGLNELFHNSLLTIDGDQISFENSEFQEYLAAKEILRFPDPGRAAFSFAADTEVREIYPTWYNTLTFLIDLNPELAEQIIDFSGLRTDAFKVVHEELLNTLSKISPNLLSQDFRHNLFTIVFDYHIRSAQWIPFLLTRALPDFYRHEHEDLLKQTLKKSEKSSNPNAYVSIGNVLLIAGALSKKGRLHTGKGFWKKKLLHYANKEDANSVVRRHAFTALGQLGQSDILDSVSFSSVASSEEELVPRGFINMCRDIDPDHPTSLETFILGTKRNFVEARSGLSEISKRESFEALFTACSVDDSFFQALLDDNIVIEKNADEILQKLKSVLDENLEELILELITRSVNDTFWYYSTRSVFMLGLWKLLKNCNPKEFIVVLLKRLYQAFEKTLPWFTIAPFLVEVLDEQDIAEVADYLESIEERQNAFEIARKILQSKREDRKKIYGIAASKLKEEVAAWKKRPPVQSAQRSIQEENYLETFRHLLTPSEGKFGGGVFQYYNRHKSELAPLLEESDVDRLTTLLTETVLRLYKPREWDITILEQSNGSTRYSQSEGIPIFGEAVITANNLKLDISDFRQQIIDFIPFAYDPQLTSIFELVGDIEPDELKYVMEVYRTKKGDNWKFQPYNLVKAVSKYKLTGAVDLLKDFVAENSFQYHYRQEALTVITSLSADISYLEELFDKYIESHVNDEVGLAQTANGLLIKHFSDEKAFNWRLYQIVKRAAPFKYANEFREVDAINDELNISRTFATPLMQFSKAGYEERYLELIDDALLIRKKGNDYHRYAGYLWEIVLAYFDNLKNERSYEPLDRLEKKLESVRDREGANWFAAGIVQLRRSYMDAINGAPNIADAVRKYNEAKAYSDKRIRNTDDLFIHIQEAFETDLADWIEGEGAYNYLLTGRIAPELKSQPYENLVQMTIKPQLENILIKRGFDVQVVREPQLLDSKRTDFLVSYGFAGPVVIEVKLTSNDDVRKRKLETSESYKSMVRYMRGYGATKGIFLVVDNHALTDNKLAKIRMAFEDIPGVWVKIFKSLQDKEVKKKKTAKKGQK